MNDSICGFFSFLQIRALEKKKKAGKFAKKVKAKTRRKMHELSNPLEPDEFADMWKEWSPPTIVVDFIISPCIAHEKYGHFGLLPSLALQVFVPALD